MVQSQQYIKCRGIRITMKGKGRSRFTTGSGMNRLTHSKTQVYCQVKRTVWGSVEKTPVLEEAGENAVFGPPWAPEEGVLYIPVSDNQFDVIVRVMDYDWGNKEDLLGEVHIDIRRFLDQPNVTHTLPLTRNGQVDKGTLSFSVRWETDNVNVEARNRLTRTLRLQIFSALGLRNAEAVGKNDVYLQAYAVSASSIAPGAASNVPAETSDLPPCSMEIPFSFQLPLDLPSTMIYNSNNHITYSVYANIDIAWKVDISHRVFFTVIQPSAAVCHLTPLYRTVEARIHPQCCVFPFCCCSFPLSCCGAYGHMKLMAYLDRASYAPGELMRLLVKLDASSVTCCHTGRMTVCAVLERVTTLSAHGHTHTDVSAVSQPHDVHCFNESFDIEVPSLPPTYLGGLGQDLNWYGQVSRYGGRWAAKHPDPVVWYYRLNVKAQFREPGWAIWKTEKHIHLPVNITSMGLSVLSKVTAAPPAPTPSAAAAVETQPLEKDENGKLLQRPTSMGSVVSLQPLQHQQSKSYAPLTHQPSSEAIDYSEPLDVDQIVFPLEESPVEPVTLPPWHTVPEVRRATYALAQCPLLPQVGPAVLISEEEEDCNPADADSLTYQPYYYASSNLRHK